MAYKPQILTVPEGGTGVATLTNHGVLLGAATGNVTATAAGSAGQVLQSGGASADPAYSTATYPSTTTANQLLYSSATNVVGGLTSGNSLLAATNSSGTLAMRAFSTVIQVFTGDGTYTPTSGMLYCIIECVGGGGGGGGSSIAGAGWIVTGGGGGAGGYSRKTASASTIGASQSVTIGTAGSAGSSGNNAGGNGGDTSVGSICIGKGGTGGGGANGGTNSPGSAGAGGVAGTGDVTYQGQYGSGGSVFGTSFTIGVTTFGGNSYFGAGAPPTPTANAVLTGPAGISYGGGGGGGAASAASAAAGGAGIAGYVVITEYVIA